MNVDERYFVLICRFRNVEILTIGLAQTVAKDLQAWCGFGLTALYSE
jgi:hypothetical protein